jgi:hypothetical protein
MLLLFLQKNRLYQLLMGNEIVLAIFFFLQNFHYITYLEGI